MFESSQSERFRILLVEDSEIDARIVRSLLGVSGAFEITHVERLSEAAEQLGQGRFDAVVLDLMLPDSQGLATVHGIQERAPEVPIVVLSGFGAEDVLFAREAVRGGAQDFLAKGLLDRKLMERSILTAIERKRLEQRRIRFSRHDELTGLPNRLLLEERFERATARADRQGQQLALMAIELDHFLRFAEDRGAAFGDLLLSAAADRLKASFRRSDTLARTRERGFAALLEGLAEIEPTRVLAAKVREALAPAFTIEGEAVHLSASVGIALYPLHGRALGALLEAAEDAMFEVARAGGAGSRLAALPDERRLAPPEVAEIETRAVA